MIEMIKKLFKPGADIEDLLKQGAIIVDVRTNAEFRAGHIEGSRNIPLDEIHTAINTLRLLNKPIITVCRSGNRSGMAQSILSSSGINAHNGGAWTSLKK